METQGKKYVKVPWGAWIAPIALVVVTILLVFIDTGVTVFNMPIETFLVCWASFIYILVGAFLHIFKKTKGVNQ